MNTRRFHFLALLCAVFLVPLCVHAQVYEEVYDFTETRATDAYNKGNGPWGALIQGSDGDFYGTTNSGGTNNFGTVFKMTPGGQVTTLVEFTGNGSTNRGSSPRSPLMQGSDGNFYGTTCASGANSSGTVFRMTPSGSLTTLVEFTGNGASNKGSFPLGALIEGADGNFYGTTSLGGVGNYGTVFKMTPSGVLTTMVEFTGIGGLNKGAAPNGALVQGTDGNFYGTTYAGGANDYGTVFRITPAGVLTTLLEFTRDGAVNKGSNPQSALVQGSDGNFYGTTRNGGVNLKGTVFKMTPGGTLTTLVQFTGGGPSNKGADPYGGLVQGGDGNFYGTTTLGGASNYGTVFKVTPSGVLTTLVEFTGNGAANKGRTPLSSIVQATDGCFYGTTQLGGADNFGTAFKMTPSGTLATLAEFTGDGNSSIGAIPFAGMVAGADGNFYGTTSNGGVNDYGTVFSMTPTGMLTTLVAFTLNGTANKGAAPEAELVLGADGNLYGTTYRGGGNDRGTVFKMTPAGVLTTLVEFTDNGTSNKGAFPLGALIQGSDGNLYGTTSSGGFFNSGTVFKVTPTGVLTTLIEFSGNSGPNKGAAPRAGLMRGTDGNFYGTTVQGGANGVGTVFRMTPAGALTTLVEFTGNGAVNKGSQPRGGLIQGADGNFYGTTSTGGVNGFGTVFRMTAAGVVTTLVEFTGNGASNKGYYPEAVMALGSDGNFYGTTSLGGVNDGGTIFKMSPAGVLTTIREFAGGGYIGPVASLSADTVGNLYGAYPGTAGIDDGRIYRLIFPGAPTVVFRSVTVQGKTSAALDAQANPRGSSTNISLEYGTDGSSFPNTVSLFVGLNGYQTEVVGTTLTSLAEGTTYYFRFRATSSAGTTVGSVQSFSTLADPVVSAAPVSGITPTSAQFNGSVNARNYDSTVSFEWGTDGNTFPNSVDAVPGTVTGNIDVAVSAAVAGLPQGGTVYYRLKATNAASTVISGVRSFSTLSATTAALSDGDTGVTDVTFKATVNTFGQTASVKFKYWKNSAPGTIYETATQTVSSNGPIEVTAHVTGLEENVAYSYRVSVELSGTETEGEPVGFTTDVNFAPEAMADVIFYSGQVRFNPLENDTDANVADGLDPHLTIASQLARLPADSGSRALVSADGKSITYTPGNDSAGRDSLAYRVLDPDGGQADGEVRLIDFFLLAGFYSGVIPSSGGEGEGTAIAMQVGAGGVISTSFMGYDGERYPLKGVFGSDGRLAATFAKANTPGSTVTLTFQLLADPIVVNSRSVRAISATFQESVNGVPSQEVPFTLTEGIAGGATGGGRLTAMIERSSLRAVTDAQVGEVAEDVSVGGDGYVVMTIGKDKLRRARVVGRLPDGEPFSSGAMAPFGKTYQLAATNLYRRGRRGMLAGRINVLTNPDGAEVSGVSPEPLGMLSDLSWRRRASYADRAYPLGIASRIAMEGLFYPDSEPNGLQGILGSSATLTLSGADLPAPSTANNQLQVGLMILGPNVVQVTEPNPMKVKFKANPNTALYTGSFIHPTTRKLVKFTGALQVAFGSAPARGRGCFISNGGSGSARVETAP